MGRSVDEDVQTVTTWEVWQGKEMGTSQFPALVEVDGPLEGMVRLALVQADQGAPAHGGVGVPLDYEQGAFDAADFPQCRRQRVLARIRGELAQGWLGPHGVRKSRSGRSGCVRHPRQSMRYMPAATRRRNK